MKPTLSQHVSALRNSKSPVREIMDLANPAFFQRIGLDPAAVISFSGGWVNHTAPEIMRQAYLEIAGDAERFHASGAYPPTIGLPECRAAIVELEKHLYGESMDLNVENIAIGCNSSQLTTNLLQILLDPGDTVLLPDPAYCNYPSQVAALPGVAIERFSLMDTETWRYVADERTDAFADFIRRTRPKVVLLCVPDNPTSQIPSTAFVQAVLSAVQDIGGFLVFDFAYKALVWSEPPEYFAWGPTDHSLSIHSNSKWCRGLGRRLGWVEAPADIVAAFEAVQGSSILCPDTLHQMALTETIRRGIASDGLRPYVRRTAELYRQAAQRTVQAIRTHLGWPCLEPQGGLYTVAHTGRDSSSFTRELIEKTGVIVVPGWGFGTTLDQAVRLSYGPLVHDLDRIEEAMKRIAAYLAGA